MTCVDKPPNERCIPMDDGATVHVKIHGSRYGKPIVLVHGFALNQLMWKLQVPYLRRHGYRVYGIDLRGFGKSWDRNKPGKPADYTYDTWASDLDTVLEKCKLDRVTLAGYSLGGPVVMHFMARSAPRVKKLVFISAAGPNLQEDISFGSHLRLDGICWGFEEFAKILKGYKGLKDDELVKHLRKFVFPSIEGLDVIWDKKQKYVGWIERMFKTASCDALIGALKEMRKQNLEDEVTKITTPTSIYHGILDPFVPVTVAQHLQDRIDGAKLTTLWGGHGIFYEQVDNISRGLIGQGIPACTISWCPVRKAKSLMVKRSRSSGQKLINVEETSEESDPKQAKL